MARKPRIHFAGAFYHVMLRGNGGSDIFFSNNDYLSMLSLLEESVARYNCRIHAFCLMTNHIHLAIQVNEIPLSKIIQNISFRYTRAINNKLNRIGHLFQGRYKALLIDVDNYLLSLVRYIHLNPVRAQMVTNPADYPWSSHQAYIGQENYSWLTIQAVLNYFATDTFSATLRYSKFINTSPEVEMSFENSTQKTFPAICDDAFMKKIEIKQNSDLHSINVITLETLVQLTCDFYFINKDELYKPSLNRLMSKTRAIIAWLSIEFNIANLTMVAIHFRRDVSTISKKLNTLLSCEKERDKLKIIKHYFLHANLQA